MEIRPTTTAAELGSHDYKEIALGIYHFSDVECRVDRLLLVEADDTAISVVKPWDEDRLLERAIMANLKPKKRKVAEVAK
jgi:hypothetical protein